MIRRSPGAGMFSNVNYVINHLKVCDQYNFIPIIDMENFTTIYNEERKLITHIMHGNITLKIK